MRKRTPACLESRIWVSLFSTVSLFVCMISLFTSHVHITDLKLLVGCLLLFDPHSSLPTGGNVALIVLGFVALAGEEEPILKHLELYIHVRTLQLFTLIVHPCSVVPGCWMLCAQLCLYSNFDFAKHFLAKVRMEARARYGTLVRLVLVGRLKV